MILGQVLQYGSLLPDCCGKEACRVPLKSAMLHGIDNQALKGIAFVAGKRAGICKSSGNFIFQSQAEPFFSSHLDEFFSQLKCSLCRMGAKNNRLGHIRFIKPLGGLICCQKHSLGVCYPCGALIYSFSPKLCMPVTAIISNIYFSLFSSSC